MSFLSLNSGGEKLFKVIDLKNKPYPARSVVNRKRTVNGERTLSLSFLMDEMNADFLENLDFDWRAAFDGDEYTLINPSTQAILKGKSVSAVHRFFTDFGNHYLQDEAEDESRTALNAYTLLFRDTGYTVHLVSNFQATTLNYQKNQTKAERFHYYNERYKAEFIISGHNVYLYNKIGTYKPDVRIDEDLNVKDAKITMDTQSFWTWCKCYFDKEDDTDGGEEVYRQEYVYQNHDLIAIYGEKEGPALYQGAIKHVNVMKEFAQSSQEASYSVSHEVNLIDLRKQGYEEFIFNEGDTVRLSLKSINQTLDIRVIEIDETFVEDEQGDKQLIDFTLTLGNENVVKAHKNSKNTAMITLQDWIDGRKPIPDDLLTPAIQRAADIVLGDTDSVMEYRKDRLIGWHSKDAGNNVQLNVSGLVLQRNGEPKTAITYEGVVAETIVGGSIIGVNISSIDERGRFHVNGSDAEFHDDMTGRSVSLSPDGLYGWNALGDMRFQADSLLVASAALGTSNYNVYLAPMDGGEARIVRFSDIPGDGLVGSYNYQPLRAEGFYGNFLNTNPSAPLNHMYIRPLSDWEVRITRNGTTDHYQDLRAADIHANSLSNNAIFGESSQLYLKPKSDGEVRVTEVDSTDSYRPLRAKGFYGDFIDKSAFTSGNHIYVRPGGDPGELRVTVRDTIDVYQPVRAKDFITDVSDRKQKTNIDVYDENTLDIFRNMDVYLYNRATDKADARKQLGAMIDELPEVTHSASGDSFALYAYASYIAKGLKDVIEVMDVQQQKIKKLEEAS